MSYLSTTTYIVGYQKKRLNETVLLSTQPNVLTVIGEAACWSDLFLSFIFIALHALEYDVFFVLIYFQASQELYPLEVRGSIH